MNAFLWMSECALHHRRSYQSRQDFQEFECNSQREHGDSGERMFPWSRNAMESRFARRLSCSRILARRLRTPCRWRAFPGARCQQSRCSRFPSSHSTRGCKVTMARSGRSTGDSHEMVSSDLVGHFAPSPPVDDGELEFHVAQTSALLDDSILEGEEVAHG